MNIRLCHKLLLEISEIEKQIEFFERIIRRAAPQVMQSEDLENYLVLLINHQLNRQDK
jgi:hypothetical protein